MKKEFRFLARYTAIQVGCLAVFAAVVVGGVLFTNSLDNLFGTYAFTFPMFVILFPFCFSITAHTYIQMAVCFGAQRSSCYLAIELLQVLQCLAMTALAALVSGAALQLSTLSRPVLAVSAPAVALLLALGGLAAAQAGLCLSAIANSKHRMVVILIIAVCVLGSASIAVVLLLSRGDGWDFTPVLSNPMVLIAAGGLLAVDVGLGVLGWFLYRKVVVNT